MVDHLLCTPPLKSMGLLCPINETHLNLCENYCVRKSPIPCDEDVFHLSCTLINENGWDFPENPLQATELYVNLRSRWPSGRRRTPARPGC